MAMLKLAPLGDIIVKIDFPEVLPEGQLVTGEITAKNIYEAKASIYIQVEFPEATFLATLEASATQQVTAKFPDDFSKSPADAPDPTMPNHDLTIKIVCIVQRLDTGEYTSEEAQVTIKLAWWSKKILNIPLWAWLTLIFGITALTGIYLKRKR